VDRLTPEDYDRAAALAEESAHKWAQLAMNNIGVDCSEEFRIAASDAALAAKLRAAGQAVGR